MQEAYNTYLTEEEMTAGIKTGKYFRGKINFAPLKYDTAIVKAYIFEKDIIVNTPVNLNRALHGDIVCIEILDEKGKIIIINTN